MRILILIIFTLFVASGAQAQDVEVRDAKPKKTEAKEASDSKAASDKGAESQENKKEKVPKGRYTIGLGVAMSQSVIRVKSDTSSASVDILGELRSELSLQPTLYLGSPFKFIKETRFGYFFKFSAARFSADEQMVDSIGGSSTDTMDLGTSVSGFSVFLTPVLGYTFFDRQLVDNKGRSLVVGLGFGASYVQASGDIILTNEIGQPTIDIDFDKFGYSIFFIAEYRWNKWTFGSNVGSPTFEKGDYTYDFSEITAFVTFNFSL